MAKDKTDITPISGRDFVGEVLGGSCEVAKGINDATGRYESATKEVITALQSRYGTQAVKAFRGSKLTIGEIAKSLEAASKKGA